MTKEEIVTALLDDMEMPYLQDWQARDIVDFVLKKYTEGLPTINGWVARDKDDSLHVFEVEPRRTENNWWDRDYQCKEIAKECYPELTWESEPIEVELTIHRV